MTAERIDDSHCNPKAEWIRLGKPDLLTREQTAEIKEKTKLRRESAEFSSSSGRTVINLSLSTNDVVLLTLE